MYYSPKGRTAAQRRVAIAKDALAQIKATKLIPEEGKYCHVNYKLRFSLLPSDLGKPIENILEKKVESCNVCALGSLMVEGWGAFGRKYHNKYPNPKTRLKSILTNIAKNKGTFKP